MITVSTMEVRKRVGNILNRVSLRGDGDLLALKAVEHMPIIRPSDFERILNDE